MLRCLHLALTSHIRVSAAPGLPCGVAAKLPRLYSRAREAWEFALSAMNQSSALRRRKPLGARRWRRHRWCPAKQLRQMRTWPAGNWGAGATRLSHVHVPHPAGRVWDFHRCRRGRDRFGPGKLGMRCADDAIGREPPPRFPANSQNIMPRAGQPPAAERLHSQSEKESSTHFRGAASTGHLRHVRPSHHPVRHGDVVLQLNVRRCRRSSACGCPVPAGQKEWVAASRPGRPFAQLPSVFTRCSAALGSSRRRVDDIRRFENRTCPGPLRLGQKFPNSHSAWSRKRLTAQTFPKGAAVDYEYIRPELSGDERLSDRPWRHHARSPRLKIPDTPAPVRPRTQVRPPH